MIEILEDYNARYNMKFKLATYGTFKKDVSYRLAHKEQYKSVERTPDQQIDLLIVVDQMLTGFDSKWINTLYLDKVLVYEKLIQAFSRTNRLFGPEKPFGTIRYYRKPYTMRRNIDEAFKLYSGDKPLGLFADKLEYNLDKLNELYDEIEAIFRSAGVGNFEKLPEDHTERGQFAKLFKRFNNYLEAAKIQGFTWNKLSYEIKTEMGKTTVELHLDETAYLILALRYKELFSGEGTGLGGDDVPYETERFEKLPGVDIIRMNGDAQLLRLGDTIFVLDLKMLERNMGFSTLIQQAAVETVSAIEDLDILDDIEVLRDTLEVPSFARKLSKVKKASPIFKLGISKEAIVEFTKNTPELAGKFKYSEDGTQIRLGTKKSKIAFLKLMNDAFLHSELTKQWYDASAKDNITQGAG